MSIESDKDFAKWVRNKMKWNGMRYEQAVAFCKRELLNSAADRARYKKDIDADAKKAIQEVKEKQKAIDKENFELEIKNYQQQLSEDIKSGKIIFKGEYQKVTPCCRSGCGCSTAYIFYTMDMVHHAKLSCAKCGRMIKWMSKFDCKYQEDELK